MEVCSSVSSLKETSITDFYLFLPKRILYLFIHFYHFLKCLWKAEIAVYLQIMCNKTADFVIAFPVGDSNFIGWRGRKFHLHANSSLGITHWKLAMLRLISSHYFWDQGMRSTDIWCVTNMALPLLC